jgi:hypothetical protein
MQWRDQYEILEPISIIAGSFYGRQPGCPTPVIIHLLEAGQPSRALLQELMALPPEAFEHVRDVGEHKGWPYVITDTHFGEIPLAEWLKRAQASDELYTRASRWAIPSTNDMAPPVGKAEEMPIGEFTRLFQARKTSQSDSPLPLPDTAAVAPETQPQPASGEFTRLFQSPGAPRQALPVVVRPTPAAAGPQAGSKTAPEGFTGLFSSPLAAEPIKPAPEQNAGEITRLFQGPSQVDGPGGFMRLLVRPPENAPPAPAPAPQPSSKQVGDFTRLLRAPVTNDTVAAETPAASSAVPAGQAKPAEPLSAPASGPGRGPVPDESGEYTRVVMGNPPLPATPAAPESPEEQSAPAVPWPNLSLIVVFSVLAVSALGLILFAAFWR